MIRPQVQTAFPVQSLSSQYFRWMHEETWEGDDIRFFAQNLIGNGTNAFHPFSQSSPNKKRKMPTKIGRWLLKTGDDRANYSGSAELWNIPGTFSQLELHVNVEPLPAGPFNPLEFLMSAIIIGGKADAIRVVAATDAANAELMRISQLHPNSGIVAKTLLSPTVQTRWGVDGSSDLLRVSVFSIDCVMWLESPSLESTRENLKYLQQRLAPRPSLERPRSQRGLRGILSGYTRRRRQKPKA